MKQGLLIGIGAVVIVLVFSIWVYLLFFGTPQNANEMFADLGFGGASTSEREVVPGTQTSTPGATIDLGTQLAQITTRPVAGSVLVGSASTTTHVRYAERGVGHVYEIDLATGNETRILGKTFAGITQATFSQDGSAAVLVAENEHNTTAYLEEIPPNEEITHEFPTDAGNIAFLSDGKVRYTRLTTNGMSGYSYDLADETTETTFTVPFQDAKVIWTENGAFVYNRPAPFLRGGLYRVTGTTLSRIGATAYGLSAMAHPESAVYIRTFVNTEVDTLTSSVTQESGNESGVPITMIPEKCTFDALDLLTLWCAAQPDLSQRSYQADWYKGLITSSDLLWQVNLTAQEAVVMADFEGQTGRTIDVYNLQTDHHGSYLSFINKVDNTLWLYRIDRQTEAATTTEETATTSSDAVAP